PSLYHFIRERFVALDQQQMVDPDFHLYFLFDLSIHLGFGPMDNYSETCNSFDPVNGVFASGHSEQPHLVIPEDSLLLHEFFGKKQREGTGRNLQTRRKILHHLLQFYKFHVAGFRDIKSMNVFREILQ
ncbi:MAG TPA: hypothetical protein VFX48_03215, partial [Saprospiraceae bacterium]|nr:hypothetical protein [Saprospiraceae bacterium]